MLDIDDGASARQADRPPLGHIDQTPLSDRSIFPLATVARDSRNIVCHCGRYHLHRGYVIPWIGKQISRSLEWARMKFIHVGINGETTYAL